MLKLKNILKNRTTNRLNETVVTITCTNCGKTYEMPIGEICWYHEVGNVVPTLCKDCREEKKRNFIESKKTETVEKGE